MNLAGLDAAAGVGVEVTAEQVEAAVEAELATVKEDVLANRWRFNAGPLMGRVRAQLGRVDAPQPSDPGVDPTDPQLLDGMQ